MDPENHWLIEENTLAGSQDVRVYVSFRECTFGVYTDGLPEPLGEDTPVNHVRSLPPRTLAPCEANAQGVLNARPSQFAATVKSFQEWNSQRLWIMAGAI